ncbi:DUF4062 domain-containing protein [Rhizobium ruizarguesonis]|uniref:DUF4062 domain-containing protein n=1 Tax=Rhizobium ruizarguesonis TaxID=2081791 RepID=UPI0013C0A762|nr:DUF4062 domain-containing protein [Rhizobium ruizarguesonis]NEJ34922.1 DUF4062 domain-containing protein [Rhizobium ruizarguesonis]
MPGKVRVFVSSTMEDLANERQSVVEQIAGLGLEPVNAEGLLPMVPAVGTCSQPKSKTPIYSSC